MALDPVRNFAKLTVASGYAAGETTVVVENGTGGELPTTADGDFNLVWFNSTDYPDPADDPNVEIIRCTARTGDTLTVTRAQESTSDVNHNTGGKTYKMILALTKLNYDKINASTEVVPLVASQINVSSIGDTYTDTVGDTYAETTNQTRMTITATRIRRLYGYVSGHVSAGTGTFQLWNFTDSTSLGTSTTTGTSETSISGIGFSITTNNKGDDITLRVKNSGAGGTVTIDAGGFIDGDTNWSAATSTGIKNIGSVFGIGYATNLSIGVLKSFSTATLTSQLAYQINNDTSGVELLINIGDGFGTANANTVIERTPTLKIINFSTAQLILNITALAGNWVFPVSFNMYADNI